MALASLEMAAGAQSGHAKWVGVALGAAVAGLLTACLGAALLAILLAAQTPAGNCGWPGSGGSSSTAANGPASGGSVMLGRSGGAQRVGASEYGGPGDPSSGTVGASGVSLVAHPDSYAELGGSTFQTAMAMGGLAYMTPLRVAWGVHAAIAYKRDFGLGGGPVAGLPRVIDLWWRLAGALRIPYERGLWSGAITVARPPAAGAGNLFGQAVSVVDGSRGTAVAAASTEPACAPVVTAGLPLTAGLRAQLLADGQAAAPAGAPLGVRGMIAAGNQIAGRPYVYGAGHGLALNQLAPAYDCSSSVAHLLYGAGRLAADADPTSGTLEAFGDPGPGRWVTIYASAAHVFMYVAGLRWDTWNAAGAQDGTAGIGWHPLVRSAVGFVVRHPVGL